MNAELIEYRVNNLEKGLEATNVNVKDFAEVARLQGEVIAEIKIKSEAAYQAIKDLAHTQKNTQLAIKMMADESDKRVAALEAIQLKKEGAHSVWKSILKNFPLGVTILLFLVGIVSILDLEKLDKLIKLAGN